MPLYLLPEQPPPIDLVGPRDTAFWQAIGVPPEGRYALIIGQRATLTDTVVIVGSRRDIAEHLAHLHARRTELLTEHHDRGPQPSHAERSRRPRRHLVRLPHTGIRVPDPTVRVTMLDQIPAPGGVAYTATLNWGPEPVGTIHNDGNGGATTYYPYADTSFTSRQMDEFARGSRTSDDQPLTQEDLLDQLITEHEQTRHIVHATQTGRTALRLMAPIAGQPLGNTYHAVDLITIDRTVTTHCEPPLTCSLPRTSIPDGYWWQRWDGRGWRDLTPRPRRAAQP